MKDPSQLAHMLKLLEAIRYVHPSLYVRYRPLIEKIFSAVIRGTLGLDKSVPE